MIGSPNRREWLRTNVREVGRFIGVALGTVALGLVMLVALGQVVWSCAGRS